MPTKKVQRRNRIKMQIRNKVSGSELKPRLSVFRSNKQIEAQLIDDLSGKTIAHVASYKMTDIKGTKIEISKSVGQKIAEEAKSKGIEKVVFDRNGYLYHGRVKALADGARESGLQF